jgi:N5-(cytidine 5'-diphosphoramidyl)-L-glutamine hydrolase
VIILVSMRSADSATYREARDGISHDWCRLFNEYGITPILVPNAIADVDPFFDLGAAGLLLTGGDNLGSTEASTGRDVTEEKLLTRALARCLPAFGVCRGLQVVNRHFGGRLERKLPEPHVGDHAVQLSSGEALRTNSFHNEGVLLDGVAPSLKVFAATPGGVVEGLRHPELAVVAVQWHPERPNPAAELDRKLIKEWLAICA